MKKTVKSDPLPNLSPDWRNRLLKSLGDILTFSEAQSRGGRVTRAESPDARTLLETFEKGGILDEGSMQLALPEQDELEMLKLSCWTLIYLKSLFPDWKGVEGWVQDAVDRSSEVETVRQKQLCGFLVSCRYIPTVNVLDFQVVRSGPDPHDAPHV
jgi:hypothetical protein